MNEPLPPEAYARVFENHAEGAQILEELTARFCRPAKVTGGIDAILQTYHRDGARVSGPTDGALIRNTNAAFQTGAGLYYRAGASWVKIA